MKNPFRHHAHDQAHPYAHGDTLQAPRVPDTPEELLKLADSGNAEEHAWHRMRRDVDPDCVRDPGSDLKASWDLEGAAAEEELERELGDEAAGRGEVRGGARGDAQGREDG